ncbi:MAG: elongation factor P [Bryobacterales bacterium]|nr:elongation factor P [Bryobacteraceae bacterium]MDW8129172.1 elongation factor P [Bryobacterales bacterium]
MIYATQLRPGMIIRFNGELYSIFSVYHRTPGNKRGFVQTKMRNLRNQTMIEHRFASEDRIERATLEQHDFEFLYNEGDTYYFMNSETFEQIHLDKAVLGDAIHYLVPQLQVTVLFHEGQPVSVELPPTVDLTVVETEPGLRAATASSVTKPARLETGLVIQVPPFVNQGDKVRVNTAEGTYQERV